VALAAAPQRPVPVPRDLFSECRHGGDVAGNRVVGDVPAHHAAQPLSLLWDGPVTALPEQGVHLAQLGRHSLRDRLAPQREPSRSRLPAHVREAGERERLGPAEAAPPAVLGGEPVPLENRIRLVTCESSECQAAREYSLIRPPRTGFRWIRSRSRSATAKRPPSRSPSGTRWAMPWCGRAVL
jgi:hypothetical protein